MGKPRFSVVLIARNESKTLPRLLASLKEFQLRGGDVQLVDTGSTDGTPALARSLGCHVQEVGDKFRVKISPTHAMAINGEFIVDDEKPLVEPGQSFFDFASARNFAAASARCDMVAMPDCDEIYTALDLDKIDALIEAGASHLEYDFIFSHDAQGRPDVQFTHCKFYDRRKLEWVGCVHEVLRGVVGAAPKCQRLDAHIIKLEHWQNPEQQRGQYLTGLAWDCFTHPSKDRNSHYLARELLWTGRYRSAIKEFERHIAMNGWTPERAQSAVFIAEAHEHFGEEQKAVEAYQRALNIDATRREPLMKLAALYFRKKDAQRCAIYAKGALTVDNHGYYMERGHYYREDPHMMLYWAEYHLGHRDVARSHWDEANRIAPESSHVLGDACFFHDLPKVTIVIPTLNRPEKLARLQGLIKVTANYPNYDVLVMQDNPDNPRGCIAMVNEGVEKAVGEYVMFLSDDCVPEPNFLIQAVLVALKHPDHLIALNDGLWHGRLATHWLAPVGAKSIMPGKQFFHRDFHHHGCDNFMTAVFQHAGHYGYAERARVQHSHEPDACSTRAYAHDAEDKATLARLLTAHGLKDPV